MKPQGIVRTKPEKKSLALRQTNTYINLFSIKLLLTLLEAKPMTQLEIIEATGLCNSTVSRWLQQLYRKPRLVYIHSYRRVGTRGCYSKVWSAGFHCEDAVKPPPMTNAQAVKRWRNRKIRESRVSHPQPGVTRHVVK